MKQSLLRELRAESKTEKRAYHRSRQTSEKVSLHALAMLRGFVQGLSMDSLIDRYMPPRDDAERADRWAARAALEVTRGALVLAARRAQMRSEERLLAGIVFTDAARSQSPALGEAEMQASAGATPAKRAAPAVPTFEVWLDGMGGVDNLDFSLEELHEQWKAAFDLTPVEAVASAFEEPEREVNPYKQRLQAINDLSTRVLEEPLPGHTIDGWLGEGIARRLRVAPFGLQTLAQLHAYMNTQGHGWWKGVGGLGQVSAERVIAWFRQHRNALQLDLLPTVLYSVGSPEARLLRAEQAPSSSGIVPLERYQAPSPALSGTEGLNRGRGPLAIAAEDDIAAMTSWLNAKTAGNENTFRAYRREAERLMLWSNRMLKKAVSDLKGEDCSAYLAFLATLSDEPADSPWVGPIRERSDPDWRPFQGALSERSIRQAQTILTAMFRYLNEVGYLATNPLAATPRMKLRHSTDKIQVNKAMPNALTDCVEEAFQTEQTGVERRPAQLRRWRVIRAAYLLGVDCGLRREEIATVRRDQLSYHPDDDAWVLTFIGKGGKERSVVPTRRLIEALRLHAIDRGLNLDEPGATEVERKWPLLAPPGRRFDSEKAARGVHQGYSNEGIYELVRVVMASTQSFTEERRPELSEAAGGIHTHALRHTFGKKAAKKLAVPDLQRMLGHASPATTAIYMETELKQTIAAGKLMDEDAGK